MDVCVLHISVSNENKKLVDIDIVSGGGSSFGTGVEDDIDSSDNEDSNSTDENECLGKYAAKNQNSIYLMSGKYLLVKLGKNMKGVTEFRIKLCTYAFEKKFKFVYVKNDLKRVTAECVNKQNEGCPWRVHELKKDGGDTILEFLDTIPKESWSNAFFPTRSSCSQKMDNISMLEGGKVVAEKCYGIPIALVPDIEKEAPKELEEFKVKSPGRPRTKRIKSIGEEKKEATNAVGVVKV
ncbi:unnamed protein product [Prunus armeniaca]|uniref:Transposase MuDR plant domain-containing protein n=1 Tax=Prunus armeniaca TaxID=36596 RepID=A0A6J5THI6_PRUAR|nr:unnamed protein product [Prunus armeniaca]